MFRRILIGCLGLALCASAGNAQILLKPNGQNAAPLRVKELKADVKISGQFAATTLNYTFQNETSERIEADFIYALPKGASATYFAYWYGEEKVVARIVEKERAAQIYNYIKAPPRQRDPALVEMVGKDTLRARIFPIEPNADLRVEIHLAQALRSSQDGAFYEFPLMSEEAGKGTLDTLNFSVSVKPDASIEKVANNYSLPVTSEDDGFHLNLSQANYRAPQNLRVTLIRKRQSLRAALYAAPSGGPDGFFALALTAGQSLRRPALSISGVRVYDVLPARLPDLQAGREVIVCGRYKGSGAATFTVSGWAPSGKWSARQSAIFGKTREDNNLATKLWASRRIAQLTEANTPATIEHVVDLSYRFTLPSKYASWLAVPQSEMQRYRTEQAWADVQFFSRQLALAVSQNRANSQSGRRLKKQLDQACRTAGYDPQQALREHLTGRLNEVATALVRERHAAANRRRTHELRRELERLSRATGLAAKGYLQTNARALFGGAANEIAASIVQEKRAAKPNRKRLTALDLQLRRLTGEMNQKPRDYILRAQAQADRAELETVANRLSEEIVAGRQNAATAQQLQKKFDQLNAANKRARWDYWRVNWRPQQAYHARAHVLAHRILTAEKRAAPDATRIAAWREELTSLASKSGTGAQEFLQWEKWRVDANQPEINAHEYFMRQGDPLISIAASPDARQIVALLPDGEIKTLVFNAQNKRWEARFDIPTYAAEGDYTITVIIVDKDGKRRTLKLRYCVDMTAPQGSGKANLAINAAPRLRLEWAGDDETARVAALLPWGEKIELAPSTQHANGFFALAEVPAAFLNRAASVTYIVTDRAHNRTSVTVDMEQ